MPLVVEGNGENLEKRKIKCRTSQGKMTSPSRPRLSRHADCTNETNYLGKAARKAGWALPLTVIHTPWCW